MFNNREIATGIWLALLSIWALTNPNIRRSMAGLFRVVLGWKMLACLVAMMLYTLIIVTALWAINFWNISMIKDTVLWFCLSAVVMVGRFMTSHENENILRAVFADNVKVVIVLEFLIATYVMPLPAELALVPAVAFLTMLGAVAGMDKKNALVAKLTEFLLGIIGVTVLGFAVFRAIGDYQNLGTVDTMRNMAFPALMSIAFVPFIYVVVVVATYELIFVRLTIGGEKDPEVMRYAKRRILLHCGLSLSRLRSIAKRSGREIMQLKSSEDVDRLVTPTESPMAA